MEQCLIWLQSLERADYASVYLWSSLGLHEVLEASLGYIGLCLNMKRVFLIDLRQGLTV